MVVPKNQTRQFKVKHFIQTNSKMQNSFVEFTWFVFDWKNPCQKNLSPKFVIVCLKLNLVPKLFKYG